MNWGLCLTPIAPGMESGQWFIVFGLYVRTLYKTSRRTTAGDAALRTQFGRNYAVNSIEDGRTESSWGSLKLPQDRRPRQPHADPCAGFQPGPLLPNCRVGLTSREFAEADWEEQPFAVCCSLMSRELQPKSCGCELLTQQRIALV